MNDICRECGSEIAFRRVGGVLRPIHPRGGCSGWPSARLADFTAPSECVYCKAAIYFVKHNGGCLWVDDLGWPWPKHPCYYKAPDEPWIPPALEVKLPNPRCGRVYAVGRERFYILFADAGTASLALPGLGAAVEEKDLVLVSEEAKLLLLRLTDVVAFHDFQEHKPGLNERFRCPRCDLYVLREGFHAAECKGEEEKKALKLMEEEEKARARREEIDEEIHRRHEQRPWRGNQAVRGSTHIEADGARRLLEKAHSVPLKA